MQPPVIEPLRPGELSEVAAVLGKAFAHRGDPPRSSNAVAERERRLTNLFRLMVGTLPGQTIVARKDDRVVGALRMVEWPKCQVSARRAVRLLPAMLNIQRTATLRWLMMRYLWWRHDPKMPHLHIDPLGVAPDLQGQGIGSQLLTEFCKVADDRSTAGYLETDTIRNVRLYQRFGFVVVSHASVLGHTDWFMWREAG